MPETNPNPLPTHCWCTSPETGLLKSVNLAKRTATNFYDGLQPTKHEAIAYIANPLSNQLLCVSHSAKIKQFKDGNFTTLFTLQSDDATGQQLSLDSPVFLAEHSTTSNPISVFSSGQIFVKDKELV